LDKPIANGLTRVVSFSDENFREVGPGGDRRAAGER
jgi:hypothetical protein